MVAADSRIQVKSFSALTGHGDRSSDAHAEPFARGMAPEQWLGSVKHAVVASLAIADDLIDELARMLDASFPRMRNTGGP